MIRRVDLVALADPPKIPARLQPPMNHARYSYLSALMYLGLEPGALLQVPGSRRALGLGDQEARQRVRTGNRSSQHLRRRLAVGLIAPGTLTGREVVGEH